MKTKCIVIGEKEGKKSLKPIKFESYLRSNFLFAKEVACPGSWKNIELICRNYRGMGLDLIFGYNEERDCGYLYLGNWNDGYVE